MYDCGTLFGGLLELCPYMDLRGLKTLVGTDALLCEYNIGSRPDYSTQRLMKKLYGPKKSGDSRKLEVGLREYL